MKKGDKAIVTKGPFKGCEGFIVRTWKDPYTKKRQHFVRTRGKDARGRTCPGTVPFSVSYLKKKIKPH